MRYPVLGIWSIKADCNEKILYFEKTYFTTFDYIKLTSEISDLKIKCKKLVNNSDIFEYFILFLTFLI